MRENRRLGLDSVANECGYRFVSTSLKAHACIHHRNPNTRRHVHTHTHTHTASRDASVVMLPQHHHGVYGLLNKGRWSCCANQRRDTVGCSTSTGSTPSTTSRKGEQITKATTDAAENNNNNTTTQQLICMIRAMVCGM